MITTVLGRQPRWLICGGDFLFVSLGSMVPSALVTVLLTLPLFSTGLANIPWALSLAKNGSHGVLPVSELGRYVK
jgi:hypothetical protein